ncbi:MAG: DUF6916 family protein [Methylobacter sp.]
MTTVICSKGFLYNAGAIFLKGGILTYPISAALFSPLVNTTFAFVIPDSDLPIGKGPELENVNEILRPKIKEKTVDLTLVEVSKENPCGPFVSFNLLFHGPEFFLPQGCYMARQEKLGDHEFFIVPVGDIRNDKGVVTGYQYQACYSVKPVAVGS